MPRPMLVACPSCSRHVRSTERSCPFCGAAPPPSPGLPARSLPTRTRLTRAALAFGASTLAVATISCGGVSGTGVDDEAGVTEGGRLRSGRDASPDHCMIVATAYGAFPGEGEPCVNEDASNPNPNPNPNPPDDAEASDAGSPDDGPEDASVPPNYCDVISHAAYGAPPPECQ
jgi:hypothetical protein